MRVRDTTVGWTVREHETNAAVTVIEGVAVPWDDPADVGPFTETFARGAIDPVDVPGSPLLWRHGEQVGVIDSAADSPDGLVISARVLPTTVGRDAAVLLRAGATTGLSVGFTPTAEDWSADGRSVVVRSARLLETSLTPLPAYSAARLLTVRESAPDPDSERNPTVPETPAVPDDVTRDLVTREDLSALEARIMAAPPRGAAAPDVSPRSFAIAYRDALRGDDAAADRLRTIVDQTLAASDGLDRPGWLGRVYGIVNKGRPTADAFGITALPPTGLTVPVPVLDSNPTTGNQSAEKTEVASGAMVVSVVNSPVFTEAGASDVSRQFIDRSDPDGLALLLARYAEVYAQRFDVRVIAAANAATTQSVELPAALDTAKLGDALGQAAGLVAAATGVAPSFVSLAPDAFFRVAAVAGNGYPVAGGNVGTASLSSLRFPAFGLAFVCDPNLAAGTGLIAAGGDAALVVHEDPGAPMTITAERPTVLGRDVAVYGYGAITVVNGDGIVKITSGA